MLSKLYPENAFIDSSEYLVLLSFYFEYMHMTLLDHYKPLKLWMQATIIFNFQLSDLFLTYTWSDHCPACSLSTSVSVLRIKVRILLPWSMMPCILSFTSLDVIPEMLSLSMSSGLDRISVFILNSKYYKFKHVLLFLSEKKKKSFLSFLVLHSFNVTKNLLHLIFEVFPFPQNTRCVPIICASFTPVSSIWFTVLWYFQGLA